MKKITLIIFLFPALGAFAQISKADLQRELSPLDKKIVNLETKNKILTTKYFDAIKRLDDLQKRTIANDSLIKQAKIDLSSDIRKTGIISNGKISDVSNSLSKNSLYGIIGVILAIMFSGLLFWLWRNRQQNDKSEVLNKIESSNTETNIEIQSTKSSIITIEQKLFEEYNKQVIGIEKIFISISENNKGKEPTTITKQEHSLTLKVADEITRINAFANTLDPKKQEAIALKGSVRRIIDNFKVNNYEIVDLLGHKYDDRLKVIVVGEAIDVNLKQGEEIISRIIKPLVKFNGEQIQAAQVEIAIGQ